MGGITEDNPGLAVRATISILMTEEESKRERERNRGREREGGRNSERVKESCRAINVVTE